MRRSSCQIKCLFRPPQLGEVDGILVAAARAFDFEIAQTSIERFAEQW